MVGDYEVIEAFLVGECGMTALQAALTTWKEYEYRLKSWERSYFKDWEIARWVTYHNIWISPTVEKRHKPKRVEELLVLPTDKRDRKYISLAPSPAEMEELRGLGLIK